ncbi:MAG TPA: ribose 5-phosphate isomerase B [Phycisphaerales bacterium]|nr:ribose 5-phosphate isomerase B [Phycisphaerales bacterium]
MRIALGSDHRGVSCAGQLADRLRGQGHDVSLFAPTTGESCDYPVPAYQVASMVSGKSADRGVLICGTGIGMSIAANKVPGARAAVVHDELTAQLSRTHNDANIICLSGDLLGQRLIEKVVEIFLASDFEGGRHARRVARIAAIERGEDPASLESSS